MKKPCRKVASCPASRAVAAGLRVAPPVCAPARPRGSKRVHYCVARMVRLPSVLKALDKPASAIAIVPRLIVSSASDDEALEELSERCRKAGASALVVQGSALSQVKLILDEQQRAVGNYPGPLPVLFEPPDSAFPIDSLESLDGLAGMLLPHDEYLAGGGASEDNLLLRVPRCTCSSQVEATQEALLVFADDAAAVGMLDAASAASPTRDDGGSTGTGGDSRVSDVGDNGKRSRLVMASLPLGEDMAAQARALRTSGCAAIVLDFDVDDWPGSPESIVRAAASKRSPSMGFGLKTSALAGTFASDQYWLNKKFKEARERGDKREKQTGSRALGGGGGGGDAEAGSAIPKA